MLETGDEAEMLAGFTSSDVGPEAKGNYISRPRNFEIPTASSRYYVNVHVSSAEYNLLRADEEYRNGNVEHSIYYQVKAQFQSTDLRYLTESAELENQRPTAEELIKSATKLEKKDYKR